MPTSSGRPAAWDALLGRGFTPTLPSLDALVHGGDYNPDQWPRDVWREDVRLMNKAGVNLVSLGIFGWSQLEPTEDAYDFAWLDEVMDLLAEHGVGVALATPSAAQPAWMSQHHPEVLRTGEDRRRRLHGTRVNYCLTSPYYRRKCREMAEQLATRYRDHPALKLWHVSNEYGRDCHCPLCQQAFREWLQERYASLDELNEKWWTAFWSHRFTDWSQIESPSPLGENKLIALTLDWYRFVTDQTVSFYRNEADVLREHAPGVPCTTNFYWLFSNFDYRKFVPHLDVIAWDNYPCYHDRDDNWREAVWISFCHDAYRAAKSGQPFYMMESCPSAISMGTMKLKRPNVLKQVSLQAVAHGSDAVMYFQWRESRGGAEQFHGGVVGHRGGEDTRVFREVQQVGDATQKLAPLAGTTVRPKVAVVFDPENSWAIAFSHGPDPKRKDTLGEALRHYQSFWKRGVPVDVVHADADFSNYHIVVTPMLYMLRGDIVQRLTAFVEAGGTWVTTFWSGIVDETVLVHEKGFTGPLRDLLGIRSEEMDVLYPDEHCPIQPQPGVSWIRGEHAARDFCDLIHVDDADVLATYAGEFYEGRPALTVARRGKGRAYYLAFRAQQPWLDQMYAQLLEEQGVQPLIDHLPEGVTAQVRGDENSTFLFLLNFTRDEHRIDLPPGVWRNLLTGEEATGGIALTGYDSAALSPHAKFLNP